MKEASRYTSWEQIARNSPEGALVQILSSQSFPRAAIYAAQAELARRTSAEPDPHPNLTKWREEMAAGVRDAFKFDELWRRASDEAALAEKPRSRLPHPW